MQQMIFPVPVNDGMISEIMSDYVDVVEWYFQLAIHHKTRKVFSDFFDIDRERNVVTHERRV
jgi:hypothetical protein